MSRRGRPGRAARVLAAVATVAVVPACASTSGALPPTPPVVDVAMDEYRFRYDPSVPAGRVVFEALNAGKLEHELLLVAIPKDFKLTIAEQLRSPTKVAFATKAILPGRPPGVRGELAVDLAPGRYGLLCFIRDPDGTNHARKGMSAEFSVG